MMSIRRLFLEKKDEKKHTKKDASHRIKRGVVGSPWEKGGPYGDGGKLGGGALVIR